VCLFANAAVNERRCAFGDRSGQMEAKKFQIRTPPELARELGKGEVRFILRDLWIKLCLVYSCIY